MFNAEEFRLKLWKLQKYMSKRLSLRVLISISAVTISLVIASVGNGATIWRANWRLEGYLGQAPAGTKSKAHIVLEYNGTDHEFDLTDAVVLSGHSPGRQLLRDIERNHNKLVLR